jgi:hypothetical protein
VQSTVDPMVLGPLLIIVTVLWFAGMSWAGMHEDETPRRSMRQPEAETAGPWWTNSGFDSRQPVAITARAERSSD